MTDPFSAEQTELLGGPFDGRRIRAERASDVIVIPEAMAMDLALALEAPERVQPAIRVHEYHRLRGRPDDGILRYRWARVRWS